jgi:hypothetical protein
MVQAMSRLKVRLLLSPRVFSNICQDALAVAEEKGERSVVDVCVQKCGIRLPDFGHM